MEVGSGREEGGPGSLGSLHWLCLPSQVANANAKTSRSTGETGPCFVSFELGRAIWA